MIEFLRSLPHDINYIDHINWPMGEYGLYVFITTYNNDLIGSLLLCWWGKLDYPVKTTESASQQHLH